MDGWRFQRLRMKLPCHQTLCSMCGNNQYLNLRLLAMAESLSDICADYEDDIRSQQLEKLARLGVKNTDDLCAVREKDLRDSGVLLGLISRFKKRNLIAADVTDNDPRSKRQELAGSVFHGPDVIDKIVEQIREELTILPHLGELAYFIEQTPPEDLRLPVPDNFYGSLCAASIAEKVFRVAKAGENCFRSSVLAHFILNPPVADGSEDSFHHYWDALIYDPIHTFLGGFVRNTRNEAGESTLGTMRSDVTYYVDGFALLKAEEKGLKTPGDPGSELLTKDFGLYFNSVPYILGYWAKGPWVTLCALYSVSGSEKTSKVDLQHLDLRILDHRIRMLVVCLQFSKLLSVLKQICVKEGVEPDATHERPNGKVVELIGGRVKKIYTDYAHGKFVMSIYGRIKDCPYVEQVLHTNVEKQYMVCSRGINVQPLNERELVECLSCILQALVCIHSRSIMHRDVRWENIVKASRGNSWLLIDFDDASHSPCSDGCQLARHNHAPEIAGRHNVEVDIWGIGYLLRNAGVFYTDNELKNLEERCLSVDPRARPDAVNCLKQVQKIENKIKSHAIQV